MQPKVERRHVRRFPSTLARDSASPDFIADEAANDIRRDGKAVAVSENRHYQTSNSPQTCLYRWEQAEWLVHRPSTNVRMASKRVWHNGPADNFALGKMGAFMGTCMLQHGPLLITCTDRVNSCRSHHRLHLRRDQHRQIRSGTKWYAPHSGSIHGGLCGNIWVWHIFHMSQVE